mmetsp:Transcript_19783/g.35877  ORF Transcript_19783/g.35877 Transcript_19783/m.35877 type:complete len:623 (-) Transcript_19783:87-1955(-)
MISYRSKGATILMKLFIMNGSVFPSSMAVALPAAFLAAALRLAIDAGYLPWLEAEDSVLTESQAWNGFNFLVSFLVVFRTSQSYNRFWDGCTAMHQMRAEWVDSCISIFAFTKYSHASVQQIDTFKALMVRLMSMLHAAALAELEVVNADFHDLSPVERFNKVSAFDFEIIDPGLLDAKSLMTTKRCGSRVELIYSWIQGLIVDNIRSGVLSIPPPILTRTFQEISNGMVAFHDAMKISYIPLPFPYAQACDCLLALHWLVVPFVISQWVTSAAWAAIFVIIQVFILWALNFIAIEIENPFGSDPNDLDGRRMQEELNTHLFMLLRAEAVRTPELIDAGSSVAMSGSEESRRSPTNHASRTSSFRQVWADIVEQRADIKNTSGTSPEQDPPLEDAEPTLSTRAVDFSRKTVARKLRTERRARKRLGNSQREGEAANSGAPGQEGFRRGDTTTSFAISTSAAASALGRRANGSGRWGRYISGGEASSAAGSSSLAMSITTDTATHQSSIGMLSERRSDTLRPSARGELPEEQATGVGTQAGAIPVLTLTRQMSRETPRRPSHRQGSSPRATATTSVSSVLGHSQPSSLRSESPKPPVSAHVEFGIVSEEEPEDDLQEDIEVWT